MAGGALIIFSAVRFKTLQKAGGHSLEGQHHLQTVELGLEDILHLIAL